MAVNILEGAFFGFALGFASFVTVLPLFFGTLTNSALLIGLIPAIHSVGWQLPQLFLAQRVGRLTRFKPTVLWYGIHERLPFLAFAFLAMRLSSLSVQSALMIGYLLLIWQGLGSGFTASPWQSMIAKIIPAERRGLFFGLQSAAANFLASLSAAAAGFILAKLDSPFDFTICFTLAFIFFIASYFFLSLTREPEIPLEEKPEADLSLRKGVLRILRQDVNFRWFILARFLAQFAMLAFAFYTIHIVVNLGVSEAKVGLMTSAYLAAQIIFNPLMGAAGDRFGHHRMMIAGVICAAVSAGVAWIAPAPDWFFLVFLLAGIANVALWTMALALTLEFGSNADRPAYIGLANTLIAPATFIAPFVGGWLADHAGYPAAFMASSLIGLLTAALLIIKIRNPRHV